ncbi:MAG TPA: hypothetical protein PLZ93_06675 [Nocardioides sp.]|uniref:hypothetical protein n=1 Tax=uncultured Nocardioides sp. TaxID=198441 RepID=UPI002618A44C|nr:hypothetical protein [uncultured Nocardioides sp.]HRD59872.1 hypothetical protein [Nocardioides sp.]HRI95277.1 hypothetical protein [Nocardioides sp.]HRK45144.1 hypothetical protein [Nocardioides sp.]
MISRYEAEVRDALSTIERAREVRHLRVDQQASWRVVGEECRRSFDIDVAGDDQSLGATLCHVAAEVLGEDPDAAPWN